ncbi:MAG: hypothetical protein MNSN_03900 [Minisyncoccus archaeiphilus]|uniref:hypothetical protein n=1 Tax=Minisyncoccus archaeiphilus TaxID=3238481 RepID=UPI002B0A9D76|nr:MAG: hypothetical protein MNSN_03900 [Candidatus Parcubacteria bacterium]
MNKIKEINNLINEKIKLGLTKGELEAELSSKYGKEEYRDILFDFPEKDLREKYRKHNRIIIWILVILTCFKALAYLTILPDINPIIGIILMVVGIIIPIWIIKYLTSFRASAYMLALGMGILSTTNIFEGALEILKSGDPIIISLYFFQVILLFLVIGMSYHLFRKIHPTHSLFSLRERN